jgi:hypothetical protein
MRDMALHRARTVGRHAPLPAGQEFIELLRQGLRTWWSPLG